MKMKRLIAMMMLGLCSGAAMAQTKAVLKVPGTNRITEDLKVGTGRTMTFESGATLDVTGATLTGFPVSGGIGGTLGSTDNFIPRADGTGGSTLQASLLKVDDNGVVSVIGTSSAFVTSKTPVTSERHAVAISPIGVAFNWSDSMGNLLGGLLQSPASPPDFGEYIWTLPAATGTLALTSELHDAVTVTDTDTIDFGLTAQALTGSVRTQMSLTSDGSGIKLSGDSGTPGNSKYYGTDSGGTKGYHAMPSGGASPAGSGSEIQYRVDATTFGAVSGSSVSGTAVTFGGNFTTGGASGDYLSLKSSSTREFRLSSNAFGLGSANVLFGMYDSGVMQAAPSSAIYFEAQASFRGDILFYSDLRWNTDNLRLAREGNYHLALREGANANKFSVLNTYSSSTSYEAGVMDWQASSNTFQVGTIKGSGGGTARPMRLVTDGVSRIELGAAGEIYLRNLPTTDPGVPDQLWDDNGTVKISQ